MIRSAFVEHHASLQKRQATARRESFLLRDGGGHSVDGETPFRSELSNRTTL